MWMWLRCKAPHLTRFFCHRYCRRSTRVFTINMQGTQAKAMMTSSDWMTICKCNKEKRQKNVKKKENKNQTYSGHSIYFKWFWFVFHSFILIIMIITIIINVICIVIVITIVTDQQQLQRYSAISHFFIFVYIQFTHTFVCRIIYV